MEIADVGTVEADETLAGLLPAEVADAEQVTIATNAPYEPFIDFKADEADTTEPFKGLDHDVLPPARAA